MCLCVCDNDNAVCTLTSIGTCGLDDISSSSTNRYACARPCWVAILIAWSVTSRNMAWRIVVASGDGTVALGWEGNIYMYYNGKQLRDGFDIAASVTIMTSLFARNTSYHLTSMIDEQPGHWTVYYRKCFHASNPLPPRFHGNSDWQGQLAWVSDAIPTGFLGTVKLNAKVDWKRLKERRMGGGLDSPSHKSHMRVCSYSMML